MARTERITIGPDTLVIAPLGAEVAGDLWDDILAVAGPKLLPQLERLGVKLAALQDVDLESAKAKTEMLLSFGPVVVDLLTTLPKSLQQRWRKLFAEKTIVSTGSAELNMAEAKLYDSMFAGRLVDRYKWEAAHFKLNYLTFLPSKPASTISDGG